MASKGLSPLVESDDVIGHAETESNGGRRSGREKVNVLDSTLPCARSDTSTPVLLHAAPVSDEPPSPVVVPPSGVVVVPPSGSVLGAGSVPGSGSVLGEPPG